jgi:2',3'-cyclic-nucleotide 2'-phosphodiesterase/3'-nucleotidase
MFAGVDYEIDLSKPKGERIVNVMFKGEPLQDEQVLKLAINNYRYASTLKELNLVEENHDWEFSNSIRDMIVEYIKENSPVEPKVNDNWRITGIDLSENDPRRAEIIGYINEGLLPTPYDKSYNLADYDELVAQADANREAGLSVWGHEGK